MTTKAAISAEVREAAGRPAVPSVARQREFVREKLPFLGDDVHLTVLQIVQLGAPNCVLKNSSPDRTSVDLSRIGEPELMLQIYNAVYYKWVALNSPATAS
jgi:hypothetical protein